MLQALSNDDLDTIITIARNKQSGRITEFEIVHLVAVYRERFAAVNDPGRAPDPRVDAAERAALGI